MDGAEWLAPESNQCRPWIPSAPLTVGTRDLNSFAAGGAADGDWPSGGLERVCKHRNACFLIVREKKIWNPWTGEPSPNRSHDRSVYVNAVADILLFVDIQLWFPPADMVNVDARENIPNWFVSLDCRLVGSL